MVASKSESRSLERAREIVARNLVAARSALGISQDKLAEDAGVSRATIILVESAEGDPRLSTIAALAEALGISPVFLLLGREELEAIERVATCPDAARVREHLSDDELETMRRLLSSGIPKNTTKAVAMGTNAAAAAGVAAGALVGAAIGTVLLPGVGTVLGVGLMTWMRHKKNLRK